MLDVGRFDAERWTLDNGRSSLDVQTANIRGWTLKVGRRALDGRRWTLAVVRLTWGVRCSTLDVGLHVGRRDV